MKLDMPMRLLFKKSILVLLILYASTQTALSVEWHGQSNDSGGAVEYSYNVAPDRPEFDPENAESATFTVRCDGLDDRLTIGFTGDHDVTGDDAKVAIFRIDDDRFQREGDLGNGGLYPETPIIQTDRSDPLIHALMGGSDLKIFVGRSEGEYPAFEAPLAGTRDLFSRHLKACLQGLE